MIKKYFFSTLSKPYIGKVVRVECASVLNKLNYISVPIVIKGTEENELELRKSFSEYMNLGFTIIDLNTYDCYIDNSVIVNRDFLIRRIFLQNKSGFIIHYFCPMWGKFYLSRIPNETFSIWKHMSYIPNESHVFKTIEEAREFCLKYADKRVFKILKYSVSENIEEI